MSKVLIVDDEPRFLTTLSLALEDCYDCSTAKSGEDALQGINDSCPNLIITDYIMPGMDGMQLIEKLKQERCQPKVILISGRMNSEIAQQARELGAVDCITKPFDLGDLRGRVERALQAKTA